MICVIIRLESALTKAFNLGEGGGGLRRSSKSTEDAYFIKDWPLLKQVAVVLSMVYNATKPLESSSNITLSKAMSVLNKLDHQLAAPGLDASGCLVEDLQNQTWDEAGVLPAVKLLKQRLRESLHQRFPLVALDRPVQQLEAGVQAAVRPFLLAMALDPFLDSDLVDLAPANVVEAFRSTDPQRKAWGQQQLGNALAWIKVAAEEVVVDELVKMKQREGAALATIDLTEGADDEEEEEAEHGGLVTLPGSVLEMLGSSSAAIVAAAGVGGGPAAASGGGGGAGAAGAAGSDELRAHLRAQFRRFRDSRAFQRNQRLHQAEVRTTAERWVHPVTAATRAWRAAGGWGLGRGPEMEWWFNNQNNFPDVAQLARAVLPIPACSAGAERLFSGTGRTVNPHRAKLTPENVRIRTLVRENYYDGLLNMKKYSGKQQFVGKRKRDEGGKEGNGVSGVLEESGVPDVSDVPDCLPLLVPRVAGGEGLRAAEVDKDPAGTEFAPAVQAQYARGAMARDVAAIMGVSAAGLVASSAYYDDYGLDNVYGDALALLAEAAAAQVGT